MLSRSLGTVAFACLLAAALLMVTEDASAGDEDFFGVEGKPIALNVTVDPGGPVTKWWWDFEGDGCFTWSSSVGPNTTHVYEEPGVYYPVLKAMWGNVTQGTWIYQALVEPDNEPPVITLIGDYESGWRFYPLHIEGVALDNDGEVVLYEWDFDGDGVFDWNSTEGGAVQHEFTELGNFTGVLRVTDDDGATTSRTTLFIIKNLPPVIDRANDVEFSPGYITHEAPFNISVMAHDPDGEVVAYLWDFGDGSDPETTTLPYVNHTYPASLGSFNEWLVTVTVFDSDGGNSTATLRARVHIHYSPPSVDGGEYLKTFVGEPVEFVAEVSPGTLPVVKVEWDIDGDGTYEIEVPNHTYVFTSPGYYRTTVRVWDTEGISNQDDRVINVSDVENVPPVAVPSVEQWVMPGRNLRFSDESYDPDGWIVLWQWDFDGDGEVDHSNTTDGNHTHVYPDEGVYTAVLKVTDNRGEVAVSTVVIKVDRDAPSEETVDDSQGAAVCCGVTVVVLVAVAYWAVRRSMATPRKDGGPAGPPEEGPPAIDDIGEAEERPPDD